MGTIIFYMVTGKYPFEGKHPLQVMENIKKGSYSFPTNIRISKNCISIIKGLLQVDPEQRLSFDDFFSHPFISTEPEVYLKNLRKLWGEDYGQSDPLEGKEAKEVRSPPKHYEKSELLPPQPPLPASVDVIDMEYELIDFDEVYSEQGKNFKKKSPEENEFNPFIEDAVKDNSKEEIKSGDNRKKSENNKSKEEVKHFKASEAEDKKGQRKESDINTASDKTLSMAELTECCKRALNSAVEEGESIDNALVAQKGSLGKAFDGVKFILLVNILKRLKDLLAVYQKSIPKSKKYFLIYSQKKLKKVAEIPVLELEKDASELRYRVMKLYARLIKQLESYAFVLPGIDKVQAAQEGVQYAVKLAKIGARAERREEDGGVYYRLALSVVTLLIDECYVAIARPGAIVPDEYYRVVEAEDPRKPKSVPVNTKAVRMMLILRRLLRKRLQNNKEWRVKVA